MSKVAFPNSLQDLINNCTENLSSYGFEAKSEKNEQIVDTMFKYSDKLKLVSYSSRWLIRKQFQVTDESTIFGWKFSEKYFYDLAKKGQIPSSKINNLDLPPFPAQLSARGLFTDKEKVIIRGYNKFFNVEEVSSTKWSKIKECTQGPYEITAKENGCLIFVSHHPEAGLLVASKHSLPSLKTPKAQDGESFHHEIGRKWLNKHLNKSNKTPADLLEFLRHFDITLAFELCDDEFEEHVLPYSPESRGLYLHGVNQNLLELQSWPSSAVKLVASHFGFHPIEYFTKRAVDELQEFSNSTNGVLDGRDIEGFVIRCRAEDNIFFFKIKYDQPYLMYREWREITKRFLVAHKSEKLFPVVKPRHKLSKLYIGWLKTKIPSKPGLFARYLKGQGIINVREQFLLETGCSPRDVSEVEEIVNYEESRVLIVPVATIGCGKSLMGTVLSKLLPCAVVQRDDYKKPTGFHNAIIRSFETNSIVYVDRNNHTTQLRESLISAILEHCPDVRVVGLQWDHEDPITTFHTTYPRALQRGKNHASLTPQGTPHFESVMWNFLSTFEPIDPDLNSSDSHFTEVIHLSITGDMADMVSNIVLPALSKITNHAPNAMSAKEALVNSQNKLAETSYKSKPAPQPEEASFIAVTLGDDLLGSLVNCFHTKNSHSKFPAQDLKSIQGFLDKILSNQSSSFMPGKYHVTLTHQNHQSHMEAHKSYLKGGAYSKWLGVPVKVYFDRVVWQDDRILALGVKSICEFKSASEIGPEITIGSEGLPVSVTHLHTTIAVLDSKLSPKDSNELLNPKSKKFTPTTISLDPPIFALGRIKAHVFSSKKSK